jgi:para-nitrobenzyl esterase
VRGVGAGASGGGGGWVFRGIPYAAAPFGPLRFQAPEPAAPWTDVFDATDFGPRPPQPPRLPAELPWTPAEGLDCLTVNVHTPGVEVDGGPREPRPVLAWIYGGAYLNGHAGNPIFDGTRLTSEGVVLVTFNYRVGFEGFGHVPGFPDNRGLLDQAAALRWIRDNIAGFGGDPDNVTVVGQSAGAGSVIALATMSRAAGLFRRGIAQSVPGVFFSPELAMEVTDQIAYVDGVDARHGALAQVPPDRLVAAVQAVTFSLRNRPEHWGFLGYANTPFAPVIDGEVLPVSPLDALAAGAAGDIDLIAGFTRDEYQSFLFESGALDRFGEQDARRAAAIFGLRPPAVDSYLRAHPGVSGSDLFSLICSDALFRMPSIRSAANHAAASTGGRTFLYEFAWASPIAGGVLGACHSIDVPFVFGTFDSHYAQAWLGTETAESESAHALSARVRRAWVRFAATGDPGWPAHRPDDPRALVWGDTDAVVSDLEPGSRRIWQDHPFAPVPAIHAPVEADATLARERGSR